ncbi:hypothetical protein [Amycolatopsis sp. H20-H5]|uniref:hypothetical protein n=1 Tax=Amycolatopsis sp. H20-H5 TaxID=3046309 RepID=UPI002DB7391B|nr:hypothetical protein [Amycolatopsis sp. H20-H5]MEC3973785.1 hypothetical protein [Amycolatopsis sp. H20-H5]
MKMRKGLVGLVLVLAATVTVTGSGLAATSGTPVPIPPLSGSGQSGPTPSPAGAAMSPASLTNAVHWGWFTLDTPYWNALNYIDPRLSQDPAFGSYQVYDHASDGNYTIQAAQNQLNVWLTVACVPTGNLHLN